MKKRFVSFLLCGIAAAGFSAPAFADEAVREIPVSRVILSTSGLANFELRSHVEGNAQLQFPVRLEQVDDILKSLVVFDKSGRVGGVTLPGKQPLAQVFKDLPFTQGQLADPMMLLNAYQGASLTVKSGESTISGKILQVEAEQVQTKDGNLLTRHRINLMTADGIKQAVLEDAQSIRFDDDRARGEIQRALDSVRENSTAERRMLTVNLPGDGSRDVALSYVVDAPLWKSAYRMVLPETGGKKGLLQGWAVVENMTAADWKDVDLTLVSGNPVTYRQALYQAYYVDRPDIPVQVFGRVMPRVDEGTVSTAAAMESDAAKDVSYDAPARRNEGLLKMKTLAAPATAAKQEAAMDNFGAMGSISGGVAAAPPMPMAQLADMSSMAQGASAAQSAEATTQVLFRFPDRFSLKSGDSMMLPFVSREVPMERVSVYQPETHPTHPLAAVELENDGDSGLPPGILTLYEESDLLKGTGFVGDAQLPVLAQGEKRLVSYALDSKTTINKEDKSTSTEGRITISQGVLNTAVVNRSETVYTIKAPPKEDRTVVIEHPKMYDYKLVEPAPEDVEVTDTHYRIRVPVKAGETKTFTVALENQAWQSWGIDSMATDQLTAYATSRGQLDAETRRVFAQLAEARRALDAVDQKIYAIDQQKQQIFQDQDRVRENLKSLNGKSEAQEKYLEKLSAQEDRIAELDKQREKLSAERAEKLKDLQEMIAGIRL